LFAAQGIRILRQEWAPIRLGGEMLNIIGIDDLQHQGDFDQHLQQVKRLAMPNTVNILLIHYPYYFDHPELGIDLTMAGDIHGGGQLSLDFVHRGLNLSRLLGLPYVRGWYEEAGAQLYVGSRPEISVFELTREA